MYEYSESITVILESTVYHLQDDFWPAPFKFKQSRVFSAYFPLSVLFVLNIKECNLFDCFITGFGGLVVMS